MRHTIYLQLCQIRCLSVLCTIASGCVSSSLLCGDVWQSKKNIPPNRGESHIGESFPQNRFLLRRRAVFVFFCFSSTCIWMRFEFSTFCWWVVVLVNLVLIVAFCSMRHTIYHDQWKIRISTRRYYRRAKFRVAESVAPQVLHA